MLATLSKHSENLTAAPEPATPERLPKWLRESLLNVVRLPAAQVDALTLHEADQMSRDYTTGQGR